MSRWSPLAIAALAGALVFSLASAQSLREHLAERRTARSEAALQAALPAGSELRANLAYGRDPAQRLDVYRPTNARQAPILLMVHGGGWKHGDKTGRGVVENKAARWLPKGFIFVSTNYRMLPGQDVPGQADDVARALAYVQAHAAGWGGDPARVVLMGHSAGAHLVALLSADPARAYRLGAKPWLGTVSLDSAALDVVAVMQRPHLGLYDEAFGSDAALWRALSPVHQLGRGALPLLAVCSTERKDQPCTQAREYADKSRGLGVRAEVSGQALTHGEVNAQLGLPGAYTGAVERFLASLDPAIAARL